MISSIGILPKQKINKLKNYTENEALAKSHSHLKLPIAEEILNDPNQLPEEFEEINENETIIYATPNSEDFSSLGIFIDGNEESLFPHHDSIIAAGILDSTHIGFNKIAIATFEKDILIYDAFTNFPLMPESILIGHSDSVEALKFVDSHLYSISGSEMIKWNQTDLIEKTDLGMKATAFDITPGNIAYGSDLSLMINSDVCAVDFCIERIKILENFVYVADSSGSVTIFDIRCTANKICKKMHLSNIYDVILIDSFENKFIATCSEDKTIKICDLEMNEIKSIDLNEIAYRMCYFEDKIYFGCGEEISKIKV